jgi:nucleotide-binding universal stress UspA family protein
MTLASCKSRVKLTNILWATDFSSSSEAALQYAASIARRYNSQIYMAHVIRPDSYQLVPPESFGVTLTQTRRYAEQQMSELLVSGRLRGIPHQVLLGEGELWTVISEMLAQHEVDLIVAGTHGRTGVRKLLLGSVAEEIFRLAACPVLTVGPKVPREVPAESEFRHILYATDFTPTAERAAAYALSLAQEHNAHLTMLHVVEETSEASAQNAALLQTYFTKRLREMVPPGTELWCDPEFVVEFGPPADRILKIAMDREADLVIMGVRRSANFPGHLPPATAYKVVCQAHCPVLTVRG